MSSKVVIIALVALIGTSMVRANPQELIQPEQRTIDKHLSCSALQGDLIELSNNDFTSLETPCKLTAKKVSMNNNRFPSSQQAFIITGTDINLTNNEFIGTEQEHYIVGQKVHLENNTYAGQLQLHKTVGNEIDLIGNLYDGQTQIHEVLGIHVTRNNNVYNEVQNDLPAGSCERFIQSVSSKSAGTGVTLELVSKIARKCSRLEM